MMTPDEILRQADEQIAARKKQESAPQTAPQASGVKQEPRYLSETDMGFDAPARGLKGWGQDIAATAVKGAIAVPEAAVGLMDIPTGGRVGKFLENKDGAFGFRPKEAKEAVNEWHSDATKQAQQKFQQADGLVDKFGVALENPSLIATTVGEAIPSMFAGSVLARGFLGAAKAGAFGNAAAKAADTTKGAVLAGAAGEGATMAGAQASAIRQETEDGLLTPAQSGASLATGVIGAALSFGGGKLADRLGVGNVDTMLAQGKQGMAKEFADSAAGAATNPAQAVAAAKSLPRQVIEGAIVEGVFEELPQSVTETVIQNLALNKPWAEGLDDAIVLGLLSGGAMGGGAAGYKGLVTPRGAGQQQPGQAPDGGAPADVAADPGAPAGAAVVGSISAASQAQEPAQVSPLFDNATAPEPFVNQSAMEAAGFAPRPPEPVLDTQRLDRALAPQKPSEAMGLRTGPDAGPLENAAALSVDTGATAQMQQAAVLAEAAEAAQKAKPETQKQERQAKAQQQEIDQETGEILSKPALTEWSDTDLSTAFRNAQAKDVRLQLANELSRRRAAREEDALQAELRDEQAAESMPDVPDSAFARTQEDAGPVPKNIEILGDQAQPMTPGANAEGANVATLAQLNRKKLAEMTDGELQQLSALLPADHNRQQKIQKAIQTRAAQAQAAINKGAKADGTQTDQAQQAQPQQPAPRTAAGQAIDSAPTAAGAQAPQAAPITSNAAPNAGVEQAQAAPAAVVAAPEPRAQRVAQAGQQWAGMTIAQRQEAAARANGIKPVIAKNLPKAEWGKLNADVQGKLVDAMGTTPEQDSKANEPENQFQSAPEWWAGRSEDDRRLLISVTNRLSGNAFANATTEWDSLSSEQKAFLVKEYDEYVSGGASVGLKAIAKLIARNDGKSSAPKTEQPPTQSQQEPKIKKSDAKALFSGKAMDRTRKAVPADARAMEQFIADGKEAEFQRLLSIRQTGRDNLTDEETNQFYDLRTERNQAKAAVENAGYDRVKPNQPPASAQQAQDATEDVANKPNLKEYLAEVAEAKERAKEAAKTAPREVIEPAKDKPVGVNDAGDKLYEREDGSRYAMRRGRPDFGGDLAPVVNGSDESGYTLPAGSIGDDWRDDQKRSQEHPDFTPTPRQQLLMDAVAKALDDGAFYNKDVDEHVAKTLGVTKEQRARNSHNVEGGDFGYDVYHARRAVEAQAQEADAAKIRAELNLRAGDKLGTLIFNDFKQTNSVEVVSITEDGRRASFKGKRGAVAVTFKTTVPAVKFAIELAHERGKRKDSYEEFIAGRAADKQAAEQPQNQAQAQASPKQTPTWATMPTEARQQVIQAAGLNKPQATKALAANSIEEMPAAIADKLAPVLSSAAGSQAQQEQSPATHADPGQTPEAATPAVVAESLQKAARNEDTKPSEMRKWLLAEIDKELLQAPDRADYDEAVKRFGEKDAISIFTGNGPLGKNSETGFVTFDVPGDGKYKVRNSVRGLLEFRKNVTASGGFKDNGQKQVKPEQNQGVQGGSGGNMAAITNMIEEGDFEAARDYAEAVGIKLEDVKVPRGDMKPAWEKYLKDGTLPPAPDTRPQPAPKTAAQLDEEKRQAAEAEAKKPKDTGWNMAGTGYGGKRYIGRNITLDDGREVVARVYENAGTYEEAEVKVDGVRKFTVTDSDNAQGKADAFIRTLASNDVAQQGQPTAQAQQEEDKARQDEDVRQEADTDASEASYRELIAEMNAKIGERQTSFDADIVNLKSQHFRGTGVFKGLRSKKAKDEAFNDAVRELRLSNESDQKAILEEYRTKINAHPYEAYRKAEGSRKTREMKAQMAADAARKAAQPITRADVQAAQQQAAAIIGARIDAMSAGDVNKIAKKFLPTMGMKPTMSKANNKAAMTDSKINLEAAAAEVGVTLPAEVTRALQADMEGSVVGGEQRPTPQASAVAGAETAKQNAVGADDFPMNEAQRSYSGISHSGSARALGDKEAFDAFMQKAQKDAEAAQTDAQRTAAQEALQSLRADYLSAYRSLMNVRAGTYSGYVAGRGNINSKQANARNNALDKAMSRFDDWRADNADRVKRAIRNARTPEQVQQDQAALAKSINDKAAKVRSDEKDFVRKVLGWKKGDETSVGRAGFLVGVNFDRDGYPSTLKMKAADGAKLLDDKFDLAALLRKSGESVSDAKRKVRELVDEVRAEASDGDTQSAPAAPASKTPAIDAHTATMDAVRAGTATPEQFKASFEAVVSGADAIKAELKGKTKDELLAGGGPYFQARYKNESKPSIIDGVYRAMLDEYTLGQAFSYGMGAYEKTVRRLVEATDADKLAQFVKERDAALEESKTRREATAKAMENPQTLDDFRALMRAKTTAGMGQREAFLSLTPEQRIRYDDQAAESTRAAREANKQAQKTQVQAAGQTTGGEIIETKHTRDGYDLFVVQLADRLSKEDYQTVAASAKKLGGWYSSFRGNGATPGFQFKDRANAEAFLKLAGGDTGAAQEQVGKLRDAFEDDRSQTAAQRLSAMADKLEAAATEEENRDRKANTGRRARFARAALDAAASDKALAKTMRNLAQAIESGKAKFLDMVRTKTQVDFLANAVKTAKDAELRAKYPSYADQEKRKGEPATAETADHADFPSYSAFRSDLAMLARQLLEVDGTKKLGQRLMSVADDVTDAYMEFAKENLSSVSQFGTKSGGLAEYANREAAERAIRRSGLTGRAIVLPIKRGENRIILSPSEAINKGIWTGDGDKRITLTRDFGNELVQAIGRRGNRQNQLAVPWQFQNAHDRFKMLERLGIQTSSEFRAALREFISLKEEAVQNRAREMELEMAGRKADGLDFFPTPATVADQMVEAAELTPDMAVLEPSAGMGHIADRIRAAGAEPDVMEMSGERRELLEEKGYTAVGEGDFLGLKPREFFTFGDVFRAPDGAEGIMRGSNQNRVRLDDETGNQLGFYNRDELTGVRHRGAESGYDRIIMNPPFSKRQDAEHVQHAYTLLKPSGRIVAIMGEGVFFGSDKKAQDFRDWLESVGGTSEKLPEGTFMDASLPVNTGVNARMVIIDKPVAAVATTDNDANYAPQAGQDQIQTDAFKRWFGSSKVVDADGKPLVVYRGGPTEDWQSGAEITEFRSSNGPWAGFFTDSSETASRFANAQYALTRHGGKPAGVFPVYLSMQKPLEVDAGGKPARDFQIDASVLGKQDHPLRERMLNGDYDGLILRNTEDEGDVFVPLNPEQIKSATGNNGNFDPENPDITNFAANPARRPGSAQDKAVMQAIADGKTTRDVLRLVASGSKDPFLRQVARLLLKAGITPNIQFGYIGKTKKGNPIYGQYRGKSDTIAIAGSAEYAAERIFMHEAMHAATMRALAKPGLPRLQLQKLLEHVRKNGGAAGFYGIKNVDEFVAEVFTNPDFQAALRTMSAPAGSPLKSAWHSFVQVLRRILGLGDNSTSVLSQALELGVAAVREDMGLRKQGSGNVSLMANHLGVAGDNSGHPASDTQEGPADGFTGDAVIDAGIRFVAEIEALSEEHGRVYIRWSPSAKGDLGGSQQSRDFASGQMHEGLSAIEITGDMHPVDIASRLREYGFLRMQDRRSTPHVYLAKVVGTDSDGYSSIKPEKLILESSPSVVKAIDRKLDDVMDAMDDIQKETIRLKRAPGHAATIERLNSAKARLANLLRNDFTASDDSDAEIANFGTDDLARIKAIGKDVGDGLKAVTVPSIKKTAGHKFTDWLKIGLQFLGRRQLVEIYGKDIPMDEYNRLVAQMEADKNDISAGADELVRRWGKLQDEAKLANLMHDATLAQIDADSDVGYEEGDDKLQSTMLKGQFKALSPEAKNVYREARDSYRAHHTQVRQAIKDRIIRSELSSEKRAELLKKMDDEFFQKVKGVYFPLARFGQYVVAVKNKDGQVVSVSRAETMPEADAMRVEMVKAFPAADGYDVGRVTLSKEFVASHNMVGRGFMTDLYQSLEKLDIPREQLLELEDTLGQLYLSSLPDLSWAKHGIHRKGTPGFSQDARRAFAQNTFHGARYLAKLRYGDLMQDELDRMQKHVDEWGVVDADFDQPRAQRVVDEMAKRHDTLMNPQSNPLSTALTSAGFIYYLGLSPAAAAVNLSQTALVAYPIMAGKWGYKKTADALMRASNEVVRSKNDMRAALSDKDEIAAYDEAVRIGAIDVTMAHDLAGIAQGEDSKVMWKIRPVMRMASFLFHHAERFNRQATFIAAYRLARDTGIDHKAAFSQAVQATYDGHFDYGSANRPRVMQGNVARVVLLFKQYAQNMIFTLARQAYQSVAGETPKVRSEARKVFAGLLVTHASAAGILGLPLVGPLLAVASALGGDDDEPWDAEVALRNMLADVFGPKASEVVARGLSRLGPWDISGRVGLDKLILPDVQEGLEGQRWAEQFATGMLGPVIGMGVNAARGAQKLADGDYGRALEDILPVAARNPIKAGRYMLEGAQDRSGIAIKDEVSMVGAVGQLIGFSPSEVRLAFEGKAAVMDADRKMSERRQELLTKIAKATMANDDDGKAEAREEIKRFNEKNPGRRINPNHIMQSVRNRQKRIDQAQDGVYLPKNRRDAMDAGRFAFE